MRFYILENNQPVEVSDVSVWAEWFDNNDRTVQKTMVNGSLISTIFLGLDHSLSNIGQPVLYETMVFHGKLDSEMERYCTLEQAIKGHQKMVNRVKESENE